eukprot:scaffold18187_cov35-Cyclotella_meneghiniana.AAC.2
MAPTCSHLKAGERCRRQESNAIPTSGLKLLTLISVLAKYHLILIHIVSVPLLNIVLSFESLDLTPDPDYTHSEAQDDAVESAIADSSNQWEF